jgi:proline iminopeptidase
MGRYAHDGVRSEISRIHLKGTIISNMTASIPDYVVYINKLREKQPAEEVAAMKKYEAANQSDNAEYQRLVKKLYDQYICRVKPEWPEPLSRSFAHIKSTGVQYDAGQ